MITRLTVTLVGILLLFIGCGRGAEDSTDQMEPSHQSAREKMVKYQIIPRGVNDQNVLAAMRQVPRHLFVPEEYKPMAYEDRPLPIGYDQTISQPSLVAQMVEALKLQGHEKVLEIGTGSGYQTAILAEVGGQVFTVEILEPLAKRASKTLEELGYTNFHGRVADGYQGWPEEAPFEAIVVTAAPDHVPQPLLDQLATGGRLVIPVGKVIQKLLRIRRTPDGFQRTELEYVRFVPMIGEAEKGPSE